MGKVVALVNQKGGVGKTTSAINLASSLAYLDQKILLIDIDPQGNTTTGLGINKADVENCVYNLIVEDVDIEKTIIRTGVPRLDLIPATINLAGADLELVHKENRELCLKNQLDRVKDEYDFIFIDCPPSLGLLTLNALTSADSVLIPVQCEYYALEGLTQLLNTIRLTQRNTNPNLIIEGVLLTMLDSRTNLGLEVMENVRLYFNEKVYDTIIPRIVKLSEAPSHGKPIIEYDPHSRGAEAYMFLAKEVLNRNE